MKKCYGYFLKQNKDKSIDEMYHASFAPLEHLFNCHDYCGAWCKRKQQLARERGETTGDIEENDAHYKVFNRNKQKDTKLYGLMKAESEMFQRKDVLEQSQHMYDTQKMTPFGTFELIYMMYVQTEK